MPAPAATFARERPIISRRLTSFIGRQRQPSDSAVTGSTNEGMRTSVSVLDTHAADSALAIHDTPGPTADPSLGYRHRSSGGTACAETAAALAAAGRGCMVAMGTSAAIKKDPAEGRVWAHRRVTLFPHRLASSQLNVREPMRVLNCLLYTSPSPRDEL